MTNVEIKLLTAKDLESIFHCCKKKSYQIMNMKGFPSFRIDTMLYVEEGELKKWIANCKNKNLIT